MKLSGGQRCGAAETGLAEGTPLINGGSDQTMSALASGAIHEEPVMLVIGTGGTLFTTVDQVVVDPELRMHTLSALRPREMAFIRRNWRLDVKMVSADCRRAGSHVV